jgi:hypothetical protein
LAIRRALDSESPDTELYDQHEHRVNVLPVENTVQRPAEELAAPTTNEEGFDMTIYVYRSPERSLRIKYVDFRM